METDMYPAVRLGRSGVEVSRVSFGAAGLGNLFAALSDDDAAQAIEAAWALGIRYFDTAPHYGLGLSERRIGQALRNRPRSEFVVSTKVGRLLEPVNGSGGHVGLDTAGFAVPATHRRVWDFSANGIRRSIEASLSRLGLDRVDIVYLHDPDDHGESAFADGYPELERLRTEGVVGAIGAGMNQATMLTRFVRDTDVDVVLLAGRYTLLDQSGLAELLPEAVRRGTSVVAGGVFNSGLLADPHAGARYDYSAVSDEVLARALRIKAVCDRYDVPLRAVASRFPFGHPAVASVLVGARTAAEVRDSAAMFALPIPGGLWSDLKTEGLLGEDVPVPDTAQVTGSPCG
ncbi:aldo/keto reductase [Actinoallomurus purpureus]|uniref:aldo/keto reductase n=1 Tax=Actinoallomurus purpureus TaxID=478114 RepID=UPI0020930820|nr:aldo/keto reductase [Actinoallomurus purpureus]MCO6007980.1 aldo/keto reductase [Actinoallomurus purpureus]